MLIDTPTLGLSVATVDFVTANFNSARTFERECKNVVARAGTVGVPITETVLRGRCKRPPPNLKELSRTVAKERADSGCDGISERDGECFRC